jgi:predicted amidohydrolase
MQDLNVLCLQTALEWKNPQKNRDLIGIKILNHVDNHHLVVLPETFTTGFPDFPSFESEKSDGDTIAWMASMAERTGAVITGSIILEEDQRYYNTLIWMRPDGSFEKYAKRHVFSMAGEHEQISHGMEHLVVELNGWKIKTMICYDLRFPVWSKNKLLEDKSYEYDLAIYIANWPAVRTYPWKQLLIARSIENLSYVIGVNRIGFDGTGKNYSGDSMIIDPKGKILSLGNEGKERALSEKLSYAELMTFREKFNVGLDWDNFTIKMD